MIRISKQIRRIVKLSRIPVLVMGMLLIISTAAWGGDGGSSGSPIYNQQTMGRPGIGSSSAGQTGIVSESYPMGDVVLGYSSSGGWSLGGSSAIARSTKYGIPKYDSSDLFMLDGEELVYTGGSNPRIYRKERDTFERIEFHNPDSADRSYWVVKHPDGSRSLYAAEKGSSGDNPTSNGRALPVAGNSGKHQNRPYGWYITESWSLGEYDRKSWVYQRYDDGGIELQKVLSGKGAKSLPYQITLINYLTEVIGIGYRNGSRQKERFPRQVVVYQGYRDSAAGNSYLHEGKYYRMVNAYQIESQAGPTGGRQVTSITPYGSDAVVSGTGISGTRLNPTRYQYYDYNFTNGFVRVPDAEIEPLTGHNKNLRSECSDIIDINADGLPDFVIKENNTLKVWFNYGGYTFSEQTYTLEDNRKLYDEAGFMDANGDDYPDRFIREGNRLKFWRNVNTLTGRFVRDATLDRDWDKTLAAQGNYPGNVGANGLFQVPLDMDGDGKPEKVESTGSIGNFRLQATKKDGTVDQYVNNNPQMILRAILTPIKKNGFEDTVSDLMDLNSDGLPDQVYQKDGNFEVRFNMGYGFDTGSGLFTTGPAGDGGNLVDLEQPDRIQYIYADYLDINADGLPDRIRKTGSDLQVWFNTGVGFSAPVTISGGDDQCLRTNPDSGRETTSDYIDMNGDGYPDRVVKTSGGSLEIWENRIYGANPGEYAERLKTVIGPDGGRTRYTYQPDIYRDHRLAMWVIKSEEVYDGKEVTTTTDFRYVSGVYDPLEREFRGFRFVEVKSPTMERTLTEYHTDADYKGLPKQSDTYNYQNKLFDETVFEYGAPVLTVSGNDQVRFIPLKKKTQKTYDGTEDYREVITEYAYDSYGNISKTVASESYNNDKRIVYNWYNYDTAKWNLRQLKETILVGYDLNRSFRLQGGAYNTYDSVGNPEVVYKWTENGISTYPVGSDGSISRPSGSDSRWVRTVKYYYDDYGNVIQAKDARGNSIYTTYDTKYRMFPVKTVNALGHTSWNYYDYYGSEYDVDAISNQIGRGRSTKTTFENTGFYSSQYYDAFGRVVKKVRMDYSESEPTEEIKYTKATIDATDGSIITPAAVEVRTRPLPGPEGPDNQILTTYSYSNGLGRTIQTKSPYNGVDFTTTDTFSAVSAYKAGNSVSTQYLTSTHENTSRRPLYLKTITESWLDSAEGRKTHVTQPHNGSETTTVDRLWVTTATDAEGNVTKSWKNGFGQILEVQEPNGARTKYTYETGSGNLVAVEDVRGNVTKLVYDTLGRKVKESDPDLGTTTYTYDVNGNLISQTDAKGQTITYEYDALNRPTKTTYPGTGNWDCFFYDYYGDYVVGYGVGKLVASHITRNNTVKEHNWFAYDQYGNVVYKNHSIDGLAKEMSYQYDGLGRVISATYPDGEEYNYEHDPTGYGLDSITRTSDSKKILEYVNYLPTGQIRYMLFGNLCPIKYEYWDLNQVGAEMLKRLEATWWGGASLDLNYSYDRNGNVLTINDANNPDHNQSFTYDNLNRLVQADGNGLYGLRLYTYSQIGNLSLKDGKNLHYIEGAKPHAVRRDDNYIYKYDANGNLVEKRAYYNRDFPYGIPYNALLYDIYGVNKVVLNDRVKVLTATGEYGSVGSRNQIELGAQGKTGTVIAPEKVYLRDRSTVYGDVVTEKATHLTQQNNVQITGQINYVADMSYMTPEVSAMSIDFSGAPTTYTYVESGQTATLAPGKYGYHIVHGNGTLNLSSGVYYFRSFRMESKSTLNLDETDGPVVIYIEGTFGMRAKLNHSKAGKEGTANLLFYCVGAQDIFLGGEDRFNGSVIAPNAKIIGGQEQNKVFEGMFIGKEVNFHQDSTVTGVPFIELVPEIWTYKYDWNDRLIEVRHNYQTVMTSEYGVDGERIRKNENGTDTYYFFSEYEEDWSGGTLTDSAKYHFANGKRIAKENAAGEFFFYVGDHLGSNTVILKGNDEVKTMKYLPYGETAFESGTQEEDYRFNGKELDATGLYYYGARFYDPDLGRFITADTVTPGSGFDPQGLNRYSYCLNNPVKYVDPSGHLPASFSTSDVSNEFMQNTVDGILSERFDPKFPTDFSLDLSALYEARDNHPTWRFNYSSEKRSLFKWQDGASYPWDAGSFVRNLFVMGNSTFRLGSNYNFNLFADKGSTGLGISIARSLLYLAGSTYNEYLEKSVGAANFLAVYSSYGQLSSCQKQFELLSNLRMNKPIAGWSNLMLRIGPTAVPLFHAADISVNFFMLGFNFTKIIDNWGQDILTDIRNVSAITEATATVIMLGISGVEYFLPVHGKWVAPTLKGLAYAIFGSRTVGVGASMYQDAKNVYDDVLLWQAYRAKYIFPAKYIARDAMGR